MNYDLVIVGGGPAGLAAAVAARDNGIESILILERDKELGGILNQCIHNGFGLHTFKEELTGPEYAARFVEQVKERNIEYKLNTMVMEIGADRRVTAMNRTEGMFEIQPEAIILAMGCRERSRGALNIPGYRPAGIYSAGTAQRLVNMEGYMPGKEVVILGSGDIGLIMARRMTLEGAKVKVVAELMPFSGGLKRNIVQCLDDYGIPLKLSHTVVDIEGRERVEAVTIAKVGADRKPVPGTEIRYTCDTLLLSCGLLPENELSRGAGVELSPVTSGPVVSDNLETSIDGIFACGNVLHVHDLVDYVSQEASAAGRHAAAYIRGRAGASSRSAEIEECVSGGEAHGAVGSMGQVSGGEAHGAVGNMGQVSSGEAHGAGEHVGCVSGGAAFSAVEETVSGDSAAPGAAEPCKRAGAVEIVPDGGVRYTVPKYVRPKEMDEKLTVRFRVGAVYRGCAVAAYYDDELVSRRKRPVMAPGEMEQMVIDKKKLAEYPDLKKIRITIEEV